MADVRPWSPEDPFLYDVAVDLGTDRVSAYVGMRSFGVGPDEHGVNRLLLNGRPYNLRVDGHAFNDRDFGYKRYDSPGRLGAAFARLHARQIVPAIPRGLSATVYTQLSDVEDELNGLLTYDREVCKLPEDLVRSVNARLRLTSAGAPPRPSR